ncbi:MAG: ATP-dependent helicase [Actinomycetota bacterium]|nr:ATP-dependent helicase [Actinomycetota bacterium]
MSPSVAADPLVGLPRRTISADEFFELVDLVLADVERPPFGADQRRIVEVLDDDQVLQILAGPGSGKTEVLVWRVLFELFVLGSEASRLMVTTFTRKAAQELNVRMVERSDALLEKARAIGLDVDDPRVHDLRIGTIHSLCDQLLSEYDEEYMERGTQLIDDTETRVRLLRDWGWIFSRGRGDHVLKQVLDVPELDALFRAPWNERALSGMTRVDFTLMLLNQHTETWIPRCAADGRPNGIELLGHMGLTDRLVWLQQRWEEYLDANSILDFATLQKRFLERQDVVAGKLSHVFVDEYQDTNPIQAAIHLGWVRTIGARLTGVGDDDQALYRFRGSDIACFSDLGSDCAAEGFGFRQEVLEENRRSTATIVSFTQAFRDETVLAGVSLAKTVRAPQDAEAGTPARLLEGAWPGLCERVADEVEALGAGRVPALGEPTPPKVAILMFSTSEVETRAGLKPALELRQALEARGIRVYNPRNKSAARPGSPVHDLMGLISYLIDPVTFAPAGARGGRIMVWASMRDANRGAYSPTARPDVWVQDDHAAIQKRVRKAYNNSLDDPGPEVGPLLDYLDRMRADLIAAERRGRPIRLNLGGLVARLLRMEPFRSAGYTPKLFRQALFTQLLEANVAATRMTRKSLERPLRPTRDENGKVSWPPEFWELLNYFGQLVSAGGQDDVEVEAFGENAVSVLTFHQAKGLEFDHVYVTMTGKDPEPSSALATELFSGESPAFSVADRRPVTADAKVARLSEADRDREVYVAITRPKETLTVLHSPGDGRWAMDLNPGLAKVFTGGKRRRAGGITETRYVP